MTILKVKNVFYNLVAIVAITLFLSSCTETDLPDITTEATQTSEQIQLKIYLPNGVDGKNKEVVREFIDNATTTELKQYQKEAIIYEFLLDLNQTDQIFSDYEDSFESYSKVELSNYMTNDEMKILNDKLQKVAEIESRDCYLIEIEICIYYTTPCCTPYYCYPCGTSFECWTDIFCV